MSDLLLPIRDLLGINRRDGGERSSDREFYAITNLFPKEKGQYTVRGGSSYDLQSSDIPGCDRITAIHRYPCPPSPKAVLYHCTPTSTAITHPDGTKLVLAEVTAADGTIFDAINPPSKEVRFCHSYIGMGVESAFDTRLRAGYVSWTSADINAWNQAGLQKITLASTTNKIDVSHPTAFPADVRAVNVFMSLGNATDAGQQSELVYVGTLNSPSDTLRVDCGIGPSAAHPDAFTAGQFQLAARDDSGSIPPGQYFISLAWVTDGEPHQEAITGQFIASVNLTTPKPVQVSPGKNAIGVHYYEAAGSSTNGATHCYVFFGTKGNPEGPMTCVGTFRIGTTGSTDPNTFVIRDVPYNRNASSSGATFKHIPHQQNPELGIRHGFIVKKDSEMSPVISETFPSRTDWAGSTLLNSLGDTIADYGYLLIRTNSDRFYNNSAATAPAQLVLPTMVNHLGASYFANGRDYLITDSIAIGRMWEKTSCIIPVAPLFLAKFNDSLLATMSTARGALFSSNANEPNNWSDGGTGTDYKFAIVGDPFKAIPETVATFSFTSGVDGPSAFILIANKSSLWSLTNIPDSASGIRGQATQLSGAVGCIAPKTMKQTKIGLLFLGSDGLVYIVRGNGEPFSVSGKIKPILEHLAQNDTLMKMCSAEWHGDYYKLAYPSSSTSTYCDAQLWADLRTEDGDNIMWNGPHTGVNIGCQLVLHEEGDNRTRICGLANATGSALLDDESVATDLGTAITPVLEWNRRKFKAELNFKRFSGLFLDVVYNSGEDHSLLYELFSDREYTQENKVVCVGDPDTAENVYETINMLIGPDNLIGRDFKFRVTHTGGRNFTIAAAAIPYKPEKRAIV